MAINGFLVFLACIAIFIAAVFSPHDLLRIILKPTMDVVMGFFLFVGSISFLIGYNLIKKEEKRLAAEKAEREKEESKNRLF